MGDNPSTGYGPGDGKSSVFFSGKNFDVFSFKMSALCVAEGLEDYLSASRQSYGKFLSEKSAEVNALGEQLKKEERKKDELVAKGVSFSSPPSSSSSSAPAPPPRASLYELSSSTPTPSSSASLEAPSSSSTTTSTTSPFPTSSSFSAAASSSSAASSSANGAVETSDDELRAAQEIAVREIETAVGAVSANIASLKAQMTAAQAAHDNAVRKNKKLASVIIPRLGDIVIQQLHRSIPDADKLDGIAVWSWLNATYGKKAVVVQQEQMMEQLLLSLLQMRPSNKKAPFSAFVSAVKTKLEAIRLSKRIGACTSSAYKLIDSLVARHLLNLMKDDQRYTALHIELSVTLAHGDSFNADILSNLFTRVEQIYTRSMLSSPPPLDLGDNTLALLLPLMVATPSLVTAAPTILAVLALLVLLPPPLPPLSNVDLQAEGVAVGREGSREGDSKEREGADPKAEETRALPRISFSLAAMGRWKRKSNSTLFTPFLFPLPPLPHPLSLW